jgi:hypothetical protein
MLGWPVRCAFLFVVVCLLPPAAQAQTLKFTATLSPAATVPPAASNASGASEFSYNSATGQLEFTVLYENMSGPPTEGHIRGPASPGTNGPAIIGFPALQSPISGTATLTSDQAAALQAGQLFVDIQTAAHPTGEIRGQIGR